MPALSRCVVVVRGMKSTISHERAEMEKHASGKFEKTTVIVCHSSTLMYANLYWDEDPDRCYRKDDMYVSVEQFQANMAHTNNDGVKVDRSHPVWIVSTNFKF